MKITIGNKNKITDGRMSKGISKQGVQFYHDLIDELLKNSNVYFLQKNNYKTLHYIKFKLTISLFYIGNLDLTPLVTIFHWDTPQDLEDEYGGFLSGLIV